MNATQHTPISAPTKSPAFDKLAFLRYVKDIGRQYRKQAMKLVSISRTFAQAQEQTRSSYDELRSVLQVVDDALGSATETRKKISNDTDVKFKKAIDALSAYERKYHSRETVTQTMVEAEGKDKLSSTILRKLKETFQPLKEEPMTVVEFLIHRSLPDKNPTIVKQVLSQTSGVKEIMWNFSLFKGERRLTLKDNPHFYERLPTSAEKYEGQFQTDPIETFRHDKISVLTDNPRLTGRVFLETAEEKRAFGNVWVPKEAIIFKDINGKLEGESIVGKAIQKIPNLWCFEDPPLSNDSLSLLSNRSSPSPTTSASPTASPTRSLIEDWREPILRMLRSQDFNFKIRISDKPPTNATLGYSPPSSPIPSSMASSSGDSLLSREGFQPQRHMDSMTSLGSTGPPGDPVTSCSTSPSVLPSQPTSVPLPNTAPPLSMSPLPPTGPVLAHLTLPACPFSETSLREELREKSPCFKGSIPSPVPNAGIPPSDLRVTITSPLQKISIPKPPAVNNVPEVARPVPGQFPGTSFAHEVATAVPPDIRADAPPPPDQAHSGAPTQRKSWFRKYIWDYKK